MLYEPSYMQPYLTNFDIEDTNSVFSCIINAEGDTRVVSYELDLYNLSNELVDTTGEITLSPNILYNGSRLEVPNFSSSGINGEDYVWKIRLFEEEPRMFVAEGKTLADSTAILVKIQNHYGLGENMYLKIGAEMHKIASYLEVAGESKPYIEATMETPFSAAPALDTEYSIMTKYIESPETFFKARGASEIAVDSFPSVIDGKNYLFTGTYTQNEGVGRKYFIWNLYDNVNELVSTSGKLTSGRIKYEFDGFVSGHSYQVELVVENQDGVLLKTPKKAFRVDYALPAAAALELSILENKTAIEISWTPVANAEEYHVYRKRSQCLYYYVGKTGVAKHRIVDYAVGNNTVYNYIVFPKVNNSFSIPIVGQPIETKWWNWALIGLNRIDEFNYSVDSNNIWLFDLNLTSEPLRQNIDKKQVANLTQFEKIVVGSQNYLTGGISALLGQFRNEKFVDTSELENELKSFVASSTLKILKDRKGNCFLVEVTSNSIDTDTNLNEQISTVALQFSEVGNIQDISIGEEV